MKRMPFFFTGVLLLLAACSGNKTNFTVQVSVTGTDGSTLYLAQRTLNGTVPVDSAVPDKAGTYTLKGLAGMPDFYILYREPRHYINLIIRPGDDFRVKTNTANFEYNYLVEGSRDSRLVQKMVTMQAKTLEQITLISTEYENNLGKSGFDKIRVKIDSSYKRIVEEHRNFSKQLIRENPGSLASLMALYQQLGRDIPVFDPKTDLSYYELVDSNLTALYPGSEPVKDLNRKVTELKDVIRLEIGSVAPAIALPDSGGTVRTLNSLHGKQVLLVFWASWSSQSCSELEKAATLTEKYGGRLNIFAVSLDRVRGSWLRRTAGFPGGIIQVSDLKYWDSPVAETYRLNKLPVMYLLNAEGIIIRKDVTGDELAGILEKEIKSAY